MCMTSLQNDLSSAQQQAAASTRSIWPTWLTLA